MYRNFALAILALAAIFAVLSDNVTGAVKGSVPAAEPDMAKAEAPPVQQVADASDADDAEEIDPWAEDNYGAPMVDSSEPDQDTDESQLASMSAPGGDQSDEQIEIPEPRERPAGAKSTEQAKDAVERGLREARAANMARPIEPGGAIRIGSPDES